MAGQSKVLGINSSPRSTSSHKIGSQEQNKEERPAALLSLATKTDQEERAIDKTRNLEMEAFPEEARLEHVLFILPPREYIGGARVTLPSIAPGQKSSRAKPYYERFLGQLLHAH
jgi:hypothetical protein